VLGSLFNVRSSLFNVRSSLFDVCSSFYDALGSLLLYNLAHECCLTCGAYYLFGVVHVRLWPIQLQKKCTNHWLTNEV
jgi:hypothetical protein